MLDLNTQLVHTLTEYDRKQSNKASYNRYALGQYMQRVHEVMADIKRGADPAAAIEAGFNGPIVGKLLKAANLTPSGKDKRGWAYTPVTPEPDEA